MPIPALLAAAPGLIQAGASLFGGKQRRAAEAKAREQYDAQKANLQNFQFENFAANQENVYEDATVNQQASQFQAQEAAKGQANLADLAAQGLLDPSQVASAQATQAQQAGADIARQEQINQQAALGEQSRLNAAEIAGAQQLQTQQHGQIQQSFNLAQQDLSQAQAARQQAREQLVGGLTSAVGAGLSAADARGAFDKGPKRLKDSVLKRLYDSHGMMGSPFKQNGDGPGVTYNPETKRYEGENIKRNRLGTLHSGAGQLQKLHQLYGDEGWEYGGDKGKELYGTETMQKRKAEWLAGGGSEEAFRENYKGDRDSELGRAYLEDHLARQSRAEAGLAEFRQGQTDAYAALDDASRRGDIAWLENKVRGDEELWRQLTGDTASRAAGKDVFRELFHGPGSGPRDASPEQISRVISSLEKAGKNPREYLRYLNPKFAGRGSSPNKRTPLYRMYKNMWKNK